jgi:hypothetical protein
MLRLRLAALFKSFVRTQAVLPLQAYLPSRWNTWVALWKSNHPLFRNRLKMAD